MTSTTHQPIQLLGIAGSLRQAAYSGAILNTLLEHLAANLKLRIFGLHAIPLYNQDIDTDNPPQAVTEFKAAIKSADGIIICSPEYNYSITGVLKNALDWASRPGYNSPFKNKPVLTITSSPAFTGGVRAQHALKAVLDAMLARTILRPEIVINNVHEKITAGKLVDHAALSFLLEGVKDLAQEIALVQRV